MACRLQKLFAVEEELEDEDFLLAVEDAENQLSDLVPVNSRCLRPFSSGPRDPGAPLAPAQESPLPALPSTSLLSPVFGLQNLPKLRVGADCPSGKTPGLRPLTVVNDRPVDPPAVGFKTLKNQVAPTLAAPALGTSNRARDCTPSCSSAAGFKFVSRRPPLREAPRDDEFENDLFLAACVQADAACLQPGPGPAVAEKGMPPQVCRRDESSLGGTAFKKLRVGEPMVTPSRGGSVSLQHEGTRAISMGAGGMQNRSPFQQVDPALKLKLRPSTAGSCSSQSSLVAPASSLGNAVPQGSTVAGIACGTISAPRCHASRPFQASRTEASSPSVAPVKAPSLHSPGSGNPRPPAPRMPSQGCSTPRGPSSSWRPPLRHPAGPRSLMTCVESPTSTPRAPYSASAAAGNLQSPVVTNHLMQLVTAANKTPKASGWTPSRVKSRRFPGPAGILPHQVRRAAPGARGPGEPEHQGQADDPAARGRRARPGGPPAALPVLRGRPRPPEPGRGDGPQRRLRQRRQARRGRALLQGGQAAAGVRGRRQDGRQEEPHPAPQRLRQLPPSPGGAAAPAWGCRERQQLRRLHAHGLRPAGGGGVPGWAAREHHRHLTGPRGSGHQPQDAEVLLLGPSCPGSRAEFLRPDPVLRFLGGSGASGDVAGAQDVLRLCSPDDEPAPSAAAPGALRRAKAPGSAVPFRHPRTQTAPGSAGLSAAPSGGLHPVKEKMRPSGVSFGEWL